MAELATIPHLWRTESHGPGGCYWCNPSRFPAMPPDHSLCAACGELITLPGIDPFNEGLELCPGCTVWASAGFPAPVPEPSNSLAGSVTNGPHH